MTAINALQRGELQRALGAVNRELVRTTRILTGADSDAVKKAAFALRKEWRTLLGDKSTEPADPGEPPRAKSRRLQRSVRTAVVDGIRRVGSDDFKSRLLEFGVVSERVVIEPRPHARPALEAAQDEMVDVFVADLQQKVAAGKVTP